MKNTTKIKNKRKEKELDNINENSYQNLYNSFQSSLKNNKLKLNYSFKENFRLSSFRKKIILKINQIQNNQQKTNIKLSSLINILFSKLMGIQNYKLFHSHFSIIQNKKVQNITKIKKENIPERVKTENNQENNNTERLKKNNIKNKIENISLASDIELKRYNLSNQKTRSKENIFKLNNEKSYNNGKEREEIYNNSNNNLFRMNNNNYHNNLNKNPSSDNLNNSKKIFNISNNRKPITFNDISTNLTNKNNNKNNLYSKNNKISNNYNEENNDYKKIYINASNQNNNNKEKEFNKSNISDNTSNKAPVKIKLNSIEKPILLMNFNNSLEKAVEIDKNKNNNIFSNIINISNNLNEQKDNKKYNVIDNKKLSLKIEDNDKNLSYKKEDMEINPASIRGKRKYSEARGEVDSNYANLSDAKKGQGYSRKIRGFNFRNSIKKVDSNKISDDSYNRIKGGSMRYSNNSGLYEQINSLENECK